MARTHVQQFANVVLAERAYADPLGTVRALAADLPATFQPLWDHAGADLPPIARLPWTGVNLIVEPVGRYAIAILTLPPPREVGDPVLVAITGRGDGTTKLSTITYYTLEVTSLGPGTPTFAIYSLSSADMRARTADGPLPDPRWFGEHCMELYSGRLPGQNTGLPTLPFWYWWYAFDGATAFRMFNSGRDDVERFDAVKKAPILLMPEMTTAIETFSGPQYAQKLREARPYMAREKTLSDTWKAAINQIVSSKHAPLATNIFHALPLVTEAREAGAMAKADAYEIEAGLRGTLAGLGIEPAENAERAHALHAAAQEEVAPRARRGSIAPAHVEDPMGRSLFLEQIDLPDHHPIEQNDSFAAVDRTFLAHGGLRAGYVTWAAPEWSALGQLIDARWVFRTPMAAAHFMHNMAGAMSENFPALSAPKIGDQVQAYGDDTGIVRRTQIVVVRIGRVVARLKAIEGADAASSRQMLHAHLLYPLAGKATVRALTAQLRYWLAFEYPTNSIAALVHTPGQDVGRLLQKYPLLAFSEIPDAIRLRGEDRKHELDEELAKTLAAEEDPKKRDAARAAAAKEVDKFKSAADTLANYQAQLRAHRWTQYRDAMLALTQALLASDMGHPKVNAAYAHEIVLELAHMDPNPVWAQLDAVCRSRS